MTHTSTHYATGTTEDWIESEQGRTDFLNWLAGESPDDLFDIVRLNLIGWAPYDRLTSREEARSWIYELGTGHPAAQMLHSRFVEDWLGTAREHDRFHRWADPKFGPAICSGCWL